ncbi:hypothetical protein PQQ59_24340 [Paraburkholderia aspalathi]|uniref:hypothetical protein n=1 Tax=Paraburkholderia aspalathi TaxID=1324617 RepID=UPI0038BCEDF8
MDSIDVPGEMRYIFNTYAVALAQEGWVLDTYRPSLDRACASTLIKTTVEPSTGREA